KRWVGFLPVRAEILAQKRFALRSVIATKLDILKIQAILIARSPRFRRVSLRKKPCISELNRKVVQIQIQFFGESKRRFGIAKQFTNEICIQFFRFLSKAKIQSKFLIPRFCAVGAMAKGDLLKIKE
ncbi:MAG: hypothetical protein ACUVUQ_04565, partial [Thermodesulfovibrionales bacterium]